MAKPKKRKAHSKSNSSQPVNLPRHLIARNPKLLNCDTQSQIVSEAVRWQGDKVMAKKRRKPKAPRPFYLSRNSGGDSLRTTS
jgi:hypothetical protein